MPDDSPALSPPPPALHPAPPSRLGLDLFCAYAASGAKVRSWVVVSGLVFRRLGPVDLGILALIRATVGLLNYAGVGLLPALVHRMTLARRPPAATAAASESDFAGGVLPYATPAPAPPRSALSRSRP